MTDQCRYCGRPPEWPLHHCPAVVTWASNGTADDPPEYVRRAHGRADEDSARSQQQSAELAPLDP